MLCHGAPMVASAFANAGASARSISRVLGHVEGSVGAILFISATARSASATRLGRETIVESNATVSRSRLDTPVITGCIQRNAPLE